MMDKMGDSYPRLACEIGIAQAMIHSLSMIFPDFEENPGQPACLQNGTISQANHGCRLPILLAKLRASGGGAEMMAKTGDP